MNEILIDFTDSPDTTVCIKTSCGVKLAIDTELGTVQYIVNSTVTQTTKTITVNEGEIVGYEMVND